MRSTLAGMAYCKHTGKPLPKNLYSDPKGRAGIYRYRHPDGRMTTVRLPYKRAVEAARKANKKYSAPDGSITYWVTQFRQWQIDSEPSLENKAGWRNRHKQLEGFADYWSHLSPVQLTVGTLESWWDDLTYDQQHNRRSYFSQFFQWAMRKGIVKSNPFTTRDDVVRLVEKRKPPKQRPALSLDQFHQIHEEAPDWLKVAMQISLRTTMRVGDIARLRFDSIEDGYLCTTISKSVNQRGASAAAHLKWGLSEHEGLKAAVDLAREVSLRHRRCPYLVSRPRVQRHQKPVQGHTHPHQCTPNHISRAFADARTKAGIEGPTFHEIRGLAISLLLNDEKDMAAVQRLAAHTDPKITSAYTAGQAPHYLDMRGLVVQT